MGVRVLLRRARLVKLASRLNETSALSALSFRVGQHRRTSVSLVRTSETLVLQQAKSELLVTEP